MLLTYKDYKVARINFGFILFFIVTLLIFPTNLYSSNPPTLISPTNNSSESPSPKLTWEYKDTCPANASCFKVDIDDSESFESINKYVYTNNTHYSPQGLEVKKWYWRVKGKDINNEWSAYSETWSFEIKSESNPSPSPTPSTSTPAGSETETNKSTQNVFLISNIPSSINSAESFTIKVDLQGEKASSNYFLKGAFKKSGSSNYFGKTEVGGTWIKNNENYAKQSPLTTDSSGKWIGEIKILVDSEDTGFTGAGSYFFKVGRYDSNGSGPTWSNEVEINISHTQQPKTTEKAESNSTKSFPKASASKSPTVSSTPNIQSSVVKKTVSPVVQVTKTNTVPDIAGVATSSSEEPSQDTIIESDRKTNWWFILGGILVLLTGIGSFVFTLKKK